jgi:hypothetical protein
MVIRTRLFRARTAIATASFLVSSHSFCIRAQSLSGVRIGGNASRLLELGDPMASDAYKTFSVRKWKLSNGNEFSVTQSSVGRIVFVESDWGGQSDNSACDLPGLRFGVTTLAELRKRFQSNGFGFQHRDAVISVGDGVVLFNSYQIGTDVVTFISKVSGEASLSKSTGQETALADRAKLDAISVADAGYAAAEWGERIYDPKYRNPEWK